MNVCFLGTPQFAVPSLERLITAPDVNVLGVVTQPDKRRGRGNKMLPSPIKALAIRHQLPIWQPPRINKAPDVLQALQDLNVDAFVVVAYGQILATQVLKIPRLGAINAHASCLPHYRGAAPIQWALYDGQTQSGVTTMLMDKGMDTGDILLMSSVDISPLTTAHDLALLLAKESANLLVETLSQLASQALRPTPQDHSQATYARLIQKSDYALDWSHTAIDLHNQIRAFFPNCFTHLRGQSLKISLAVPLCHRYTPAFPPAFSHLVEKMQDFDLANHTPGTIVHLAKNWGPIVATGKGSLLLREVQLAGRKRQLGWDFINGVRLQVGERLVNG